MTLEQSSTVRKSNEWRLVSMGDVVEVKNELERNPKEAGFERYLKVEHLDPDSLRIKRWGMVEDGDLPPTFYKIFRKGQVLYPTRNPHLRRTAYAEFDGICGEKTLTLEAKREYIIPELLPFLFQQERFIQHATSNMIGSTNPHIRWRDIASYKFPLPPKNKQRRIADMLWAADESFQARERVLAEVIKLRQLVIDDLFSNAEGGGTVALREVCEMQNGRPFPSSDYQSLGVKLLRPGNLGSDGYFYWSEDATKFLPESYMQIAADFIVKENDVVINLTAQSLEDGFMGRVCLARHDDSSLLNQRIGRFRHAESINSEYLFRCLQTSRFRKLVETSCEGSKIRHLYWRHIEGFMITLPSKREQKHAVEAVASVDTAIQAARKNVLDSWRLRSQLREELLSSH